MDVDVGLPVTKAFFDPATWSGVIAEIAISFIDLGPGEQTAQACANA
jgi:hypothetical protein